MVQVAATVRRRAGRLPPLQMTRRRIDHGQEISLNEYKRWILSV
jgi:hypothetical protein